MVMVLVATGAGWAVEQEAPCGCRIVCTVRFRGLEITWCGHVGRAPETCLLAYMIAHRGPCMALPARWTRQLVGQAHSLGSPVCNANKPMQPLSHLLLLLVKSMVGSEPNLNCVPLVNSVCTQPSDWAVLLVAFGCQYLLGLNAAAWAMLSRIHLPRPAGCSCRPCRRPGLLPGLSNFTCQIWQCRRTSGGEVQPSSCCTVANA